MHGISSRTESGSFSSLPWAEHLRIMASAVEEMACFVEIELNHFRLGVQFVRATPGAPPSVMGQRYRAPVMQPEVHSDDITRL
jgi:hypothetical protein